MKKLNKEELLAYTYNYLSYLFRSKTTLINQVILFGSVARGDFDENSDVDIFIDVDSKNEKEMNKIAERVERLLEMPVLKVDDCIDIKIPDARIIMLENLRFHSEEEKNDEIFSERLSKLADVYVNDAFGTMHRAHASTVGVTKFLPGCIGFLVEKELKYLTLKDPERPFIAILGGAKISTKIPIIKELIKKVDYLLLGGAMVFTMYKAKGHEIGKSLYEEEYLAEAKMLLSALGLPFEKIQ